MAMYYCNVHITYITSRPFLVFKKMKFANDSNLQYTALFCVLWKPKGRTRTFNFYFYLKKLIFAR